MTSTATGPTRSRALRAGVFALVSVLVAGLGHAAGHGAVPSGSTLVLAVVAALAVGALISRSRWSVARLLAGLAAVQVVVHGAAWVASGPGGPVDPRLAAIAVQHETHSAHAAPFTLRMLIAHALAVVVSAVLLAVIEHAAVTALAAARRLAPVARVLVPSLPPLRIAAGAGLVVVPAEHLAVVRGHAPPRAA